MASKAADNGVYEDFEPSHEWSRDEGLFTVMLPGFTRNQLKVQVTSKPALRLMGERPVTQNRRHRFNLELPIPSDYDTDNVSAKFEAGRLLVKFGKLTKPRETMTKETPRPMEPSPKVDQQKAAKAKEDKTESKTNDELSEQKEETKTETTDSTGKVTSETTTEASKPKVAKPVVSRSKTRLIDFTLSSGLSSEALRELDTGRNKWKRLVKWVLLIVSAVGLGLGARYAWNLRSSQGYGEGESNLQDL